MDWLVESVRDEFSAGGRRPVFFVLCGLVLGFLAIRTSARLIRARVPWWPHDLVAGGVHLHHELFGVGTMIVTGTGAFVVPAGSGWYRLLAFGFGVGAGLVLDEFALLLHLRDVYWAKEGRASIDAVFVATTLVGMLALGAAPFGLTEATDTGSANDPAAARLFGVALVLVNAGLTVVTALKGKYWTALLSVPLWFVGILGALRLARPGSPWARRRYRTGSAVHDRAGRRAARWDHVVDRVVTAIGGRVEG